RARAIRPRLRGAVSRRGNGQVRYGEPAGGTARGAAQTKETARGREAKGRDAGDPRQVLGHIVRLGRGTALREAGALSLAANGMALAEAANTAEGQERARGQEGIV